MNLRPFQIRGIEILTNALRTGERVLASAPTGAGKTAILGEVQRATGAVIVSPAAVHGSILSKYPDAAVTTAVRLRNHLADGGLKPSGILWDEAHHDTCSSYEEVSALARCPEVGVTATPFRGTPKGTLALRSKWRVERLLGYREAAELGYIHIPTCRMLPLVDDDLIQVSNGEFVVQAAGDGLLGRIGELAAEANLDKSTMYAFPSVSSARDAATQFRVPVRVVTGETPESERLEAFAETLARKCLLFQISTVSEGVDLQLERLVDCRPTQSPVFWLQLIGRIMRVKGEYVCTNRNLERHGYLLDGLAPVAAAQGAFGKPSVRAGQRLVGLEALGRFKVVPFPLAGRVGHMYQVLSFDGHKSVQWCLLADPGGGIVCARRENEALEDGTRDYGKWVAAELPADLSGFKTAPARAPSPKQLLWWQRAAARHGLDASVTPDSRTFAALPVLSDLGIRM